MTAPEELLEYLDAGHVDSWVVVMNRNPWGGGAVQILGVYTSHEAAEARAWRAHQRIAGIPFYADAEIWIVTQPLNLGNEDDGGRELHAEIQGLVKTERETA